MNKLALKGARVSDFDIFFRFAGRLDTYDSKYNVNTEYEWNGLEEKKTPSSNCRFPLDAFFCVVLATLFVFQIKANSAFNK